VAITEPTDQAASGDLEDLAARLGHQFERPELLRRAMAHRSYCAEVTGVESNERLEFLGDAVLGWVVADVVFRRHPDMAEGQLTDLRKSVVNANFLAQVARDIDLGAHLLLGKGEDAAGGRDKPSILSDALEAVIGAMYLDGGPDVAHRLVAALIGEGLDVAARSLDHLDHKTQLQELAARFNESAPIYVVRGEGPDHLKRFFATVYIGGEARGEGQGGSKKVAEQAAAAEACERLAAETADRD
jgi:ribonuclease-3